MKTPCFSTAARAGRPAPRVQGKRPGSLFLPHGKGRARKKRIPVILRFAVGDADRGGKGPRKALRLAKLAQATAQLRGFIRHHLRTRSARHIDAEHIFPRAGNDIARPEKLRQRQGRAAQNFIPRQMAGIIIDRFKIIKIQQDKRAAARTVQRT